MKSLKSLLKCLIVIASLITVNQVYANHNNLDEWKFTKNQVTILKKAKQKCNQRNVDGYLCAAIVWHESSAGKNKIGGGSVGNFHNLVKTVVNREKIWKKKNQVIYIDTITYSKVKQKLLTDFNYEVIHTVAQLKECEKHLKKINKFNQTNVLSCYNGGIKGHKIRASIIYAKNVMKKKVHLQKIGL